MRALVWLVLIGGLHVAFLFGLPAYGSLADFHFTLPYSLAVFAWLGVPSILAAIAYYKVGSRVALLAGPARAIPFAVVATAISLYVGMVLVLNAFGS